MNQFSGMFNQNSENIFKQETTQEAATTTTSMIRTVSSMFETTSTNASFTSETTTPVTSTAIARVGETLHALFAHVMALEIDSLTSFMLVLLFSTFMYALVKKCFSYYR